MSYTKNISALAISQIVTAVCNFLSALLIAKMLLPAGQGQWSLYVNAYAFGAVALSFGLPQALTYFIASKKLKKDAVLTHSIFFALLVGSVFTLIIFILSITNAANIFLPNDIPLYLICCGLGLHFTLLLTCQLFVAVFHANRKFVTAASIALTGAILLVLLYVMYYFLGANYQSYFTGFIIGNIAILTLQCLLALFFLNRDLKYNVNPKNWSLAFYKPLMLYAAWIYITNMLQFLNYKMDVWFISAHVEDENRLGIYTVTASLAQLLWLVPTAFHSVIFTDIAEKNTPAFRARIITWTKKVLLLSAILGIAGYLLSFVLVPVLFGSAYSDISIVLPYLLPGVVFFSASILISAYFSGINRIDINFKSTGLGFVICVVLNISLIPSLGIVGAAIASSISYSISAFYLYYLFSKE